MKNHPLLLLLLGFLLAQSTFAGGNTANSPAGGAYLVFAEKMGGEVSPESIQQVCELQVEGCAKGSRIFTFVLVVNKKGKKRSFQAESNELSAEMMAALRSLEAGDRFEFKKIKAYLPNGKAQVDVFAKPFRVI